MNELLIAMNLAFIISSYKKLVETAVLIEEVKNSLNKYTKHNYDEAMSSCNDVLELCTEIQKIVQKTEELANKLTISEKRVRIQQLMSNCPIDKLIDHILDSQNEIKRKFNEKKIELTNMNKYKRQFLFYIGVEDSSIMEIDFSIDKK